MIMLIVLGFLTGVLFGLRFKVIILVPIIMLAWALTITIDAMHGVGFWWIVLDMFVLSTALQVGYLAGAALAVIRGVMTFFELFSGSAGEPLRRKELGLAWSSQSRASA
jgi:hypothetical protein